MNTWRQNDRQEIQLKKKQEENKKRRGEDAGIVSCLFKANVLDTNNTLVTNRSIRDSSTQSL